MDTINRLLKKQAPKRRRKADMNDDEDGMGNRPPLSFVRTVQIIEGTRLGVPEEWVDAPVGEIFKKTVKTSATSNIFQMVSVVD
jgi:Ino eighty subunit 2